MATIALIPRVSVLIPTYNCASYLPETIASVTAQSFQDFEGIIVDDGSTDNTEEVLRKLDHRFRYVKQEHSGIPAKAGNKAVELARGEFVAFLDSDDLWEQDKLECQVRLMDKEPYLGVCFGDHSIVGASVDARTAFDLARDKLDRLQKKRVGEDEYVVTSRSMLEDCLLRGPIPIMTDTIFLRRICLSSIGPFNEEMPLDEDTQMWFRLVKNCSVGYIDKMLARRRIRPSSITAGTDQQRKFIYSLRTLETLDQWISVSKSEGSAIQKRMAQISFSLAYNHFSQDNLKEARQWFCCSLRKQFSLKTMQFLFYASIPLRTVRSLRYFKRRLAGNPEGKRNR